jgi:hypothetical protein
MDGKTKYWVKVNVSLLVNFQATVIIVDTVKLREGSL